MVNRALLSALAVCFAVAGCEKPAEPPKTKPAAAVVPLPPEAPKAPAASAGQDAQPAQMAQAAALPTSGGCKAGQCKVELDVTGDDDSNCKIKKTPDALPVWTQNKNDTMRWIINTADWEFDNDGIKLVTPNPQFTAPGHDGAKHKYKIVNANTDTASTAHYYKISLTNKKTGKKCTKDPSIVNGVAQP